MIAPAEVVIDIQSGSTPFGELPDPPRFVGGRLVNTVPPVMIVLARDLSAALRDGGDSMHGDAYATATPDGMFRVDSLDGSWVWELLPARFSDDRPYDPPCYLAVWRD